MVNWAGRAIIVQTAALEESGRSGTPPALQNKHNDSNPGAAVATLELGVLGWARWPPSPHCDPALQMPSISAIQGAASRPEVVSQVNLIIYYFASNGEPLRSSAFR